MIKSTWKALSLMFFCITVMLMNPVTAVADEIVGSGFKTENYTETVETETVNTDSEDTDQEDVNQKDDATIATTSVATDTEADFRQGVVNYALQFVGGRYAAGGNDPHTGVDCSGFTRYVMQHAAGISLNRSSGGQASQGTAVSSDQMRPGDLVFYSNGRSINHVAMYIGGGQVVHASTYKTGIKTSPWNYRAPVKVVNVIGD